MANRVTYELHPDSPSFKMNNTCSSYLINALAEAASALARCDRERDFAIWIAGHDQGVFGLGMVGFDVAEIPWSPEGFPEEKDFVIRAIEAAKGVLDDCGLSDEHTVGFFEAFRNLVKILAVEHAGCDEERVWASIPRPPGRRLCPEHRVYLHRYGCVICNDT